MQKILITGATGFLGSHLTRFFVQSGYSVIALKRSFSKLDRLLDVADKIEFYDIDKMVMKDIFEKNQDIHTIIHTATSYGKNNESLSELFLSNVIFPLQLLEYSSKHNIKAFLNTDTFFNRNNGENAYQYLNSYTLTKRSFLELAKQISAEQKIKVINLKLEHIYGPGDDTTKFVTNIIQKLMTNVGKIELTPGQQKRDFIYVKDVVAAYSHVLANIDKIEDSFLSLPVGTGTSITLEHFIGLAKKIINSNSELVFGAIDYRINEIMDSYADNSLLEKLGWKPCYSIEEGLKETIRFEQEIEIIRRGYK